MDEMLEAIKENIRLTGAMSSDEITEFNQLIDKYWIGFSPQSHISS